MAEPGVDAQPDTVPGRVATELAEHVDRAGVDRDLVPEDERERLLVEEVGGQHEVRGLARAAVADPERPLGLPGRDGVDGNALRAQEPEEVDVRACLLGVADEIEALEVGDPGADHLGLVAVDGRPESSSDLDRQLGIGFWHGAPRYRSRTAVCPPAGSGADAVTEYRMPPPGK